MDTLLVDYKDACIYGRDLHLLKSPTAWLNDSCIHYALVRLQQEHEAVVLVDPVAVTCLVQQCQDEEDLEDFAQGYQHAKGKRVFLPVNDALTGSMTVGGGSHWSLLVVDDDGLYYHFDSASGNARAARIVARQWSRLFGRDAPKVEEMTTPKQANGYDCGLHVIAAATALFHVPMQDAEKVLKDAINESTCPELRKDLVEHILKMSKK